METGGNVGVRSVVIVGAGAETSDAAFVGNSLTSSR